MLLDKIEAAFHGLFTFLAGLVALSIGIWAILIPLDLFLVRTGWGNLFWMTAIIEYSVFAGVFLAAPWVLQKNGHVRVDVLVGGLPSPAANYLELVVNTFGVLVCLALAWYGLDSMLLTYSDGDMIEKDVRLPVWQPIALFIFSMVLLAIEFLFRALRSFRDRGEGDGEHGSEGF